MSSSPISITLASEDDAATLASITTLAFAATDPAYPLIWGKAAEGTHDAVTAKGLFSPVQTDTRRTFKAVLDGKIVGFATWVLPKVELGPNASEQASGLPTIPGVNMDLWAEKMEGSRMLQRRDFDAGKDMRLSLFFVHPDYQGRGIGSKLLEWGKRTGDETGCKIWLTSTPQATHVYEKNGWRLVEQFELDLSKHGGKGTYVRAWMLRSPITPS